MPRAPYADEDVYDDIIDYGFKFDGHDGVKGEAQERLKSFFTHSHPNDISDKTEALVDRIIEIHYGKLSPEEADPDLIGSNPTGDIKQRVERKVFDNGSEYVLKLSEETDINKIRKLEFKSKELQEYRDSVYVNEAGTRMRNARNSADLNALKRLKSDIAGTEAVTFWGEDVDTAIKNLESGLVYRGRHWTKRRD